MPPVLPPGFSEASAPIGAGRARPRARGRGGSTRPTSRRPSTSIRSPWATRCGSLPRRSSGPVAVEEIQAVLRIANAIGSRCGRLARAQPRLRRHRAARPRLRRPGAQPDEPRARGGRGARLRAARTRGVVLRPLRAPAPQRPPAVDVRARPRMGQRRRQRARARLRPGALRRALGRHLRAGGRDGGRRPRPHGMGSIGDGRAWHVYKGGYGPSLGRAVLQSNYGVVTKWASGSCPSRSPSAPARSRSRATRTSSR